MQRLDLPFGVTDWSTVAAEDYTRITGTATRQFGPVRVRMADCSPDYPAGHWCQKGQFLLVTELADGRLFTRPPGMSYPVADGAEVHCSRSPHGAALFIVD